MSPKKTATICHKFSGQSSHLSQTLPPKKISLQIFPFKRAIKKKGPKTMCGAVIVSYNLCSYNWVPPSFKMGGLYGPLEKGKVYGYNFIIYQGWRRHDLVYQGRPTVLDLLLQQISSFLVAWVFEILRANSKLGSIDFRFTVRAVENSTLGTHAGVQSYHSKGLTWVQLSLFGPFFPLFMDEFFHGFSIPRFSSCYI